MKLIHYRDNCIGCNSCVQHAPHYWAISPIDGKADLLGSIQKKDVFILKVDESEKEIHSRVVRDCPMRIIKLSQ
ncbi:TPA: ferredoxin [Candidatus Woesearchaeota archaeon]|nr:ferredoxin [Candidatus Woesearchaeota archaeon]